jgi:hypothetical protein
MPATKIADILVPDVWVPYMIVRTAELSALFQSGIITQSEQLNALASGGGTLFDMPFFNDLSGDSEVLSDSTALSVNKITTAKDVAVKHFRGKAWGANDLAKALSGADPMGAIADLVAAYWSRDFQKTLISTLRGVFAATSMATTHVHNVAIEDGNAATATNKISATTTIDAFSKLGDQTDSLSAIAMHSVPYYNLLKQDLIEFEQPSEQGKPIQRYLGRQVIIDDGCPVVNGTTSGKKYTSYLFGAGAIGYGEGNPETPVETDRDSLQGEDYLINRRHFILHPGGVKWQGTAAGTSPTNAELATGTNWARVYDAKLVKVIALISNG